MLRLIFEFCVKKLFSPEFAYWWQSYERLFGQTRRAKLIEFYWLVKYKEFGTGCRASVAMSAALLSKGPTHSCWSGTRWHVLFQMVLLVHSIIVPLLNFRSLLSLSKPNEFTSSLVYDLSKQSHLISNLGFHLVNGRIRVKFKTYQVAAKI